MNRTVFLGHVVTQEIEEEDFMAEAICGERIDVLGTSRLLEAWVDDVTCVECRRLELHLRHVVRVKG